MAKQGLRIFWILKTKIGLIRGKKNVKRKKKKKKKKRKKRRSSKPRYGTLDFCMETHLGYEFYEIWHGSLGLYDD